MDESQSAEQNQNFLKEQAKKLDQWNFEAKPAYSSVNFLSGLFENIRINHPDFIEISNDSLPSEIKDGLEKPYGRTSILLGKGTEWVRIKEDRGLPVVIIEGQGKSFTDNWSFYFILDSDHVRVRDASAAGANSISVIKFIDKYKNDNKTLINIVSKLAKTVLAQITSPTTDKAWLK